MRHRRLAAVIKPLRSKVDSSGYLQALNAREITMPYTPAQQRMLHADAEGRGTKGPSAAVAKKMLAEHAPTRTDVDRAGHAKKKRKKKAGP
jgi:hypothetical protein